MDPDELYAIGRRPEETGAVEDFATVERRYGEATEGGLVEAMGRTTRASASFSL